MAMNFRPLIAAVGIALVAPGFAESAMGMLPGGNPFPMMADGRDPLPPYLRGVELSDAQRDSIFDVLHAQAAELRVREKQLRQANDALMKLSLATEFDEARAKALSEDSSRALAEIALMRARSDNKIYHLLRPEQRKQIGVVRPPASYEAPSRHS